MNRGQVIVKSSVNSYGLLYGNTESDRGSLKIIDTEKNKADAALARDCEAHGILRNWPVTGFQVFFSWGKNLKTSSGNGLLSKFIFKLKNQY